MVDGSVTYLSVGIAGIFVAAATKLSTSADDLLWLPRYVRAWPKLAIVSYVLSLNVVVVAAWMTQQFATNLVDERMLTTIALILLLGFACYVYWRDNVRASSQADEKEKGDEIFKTVPAREAALRVAYVTFVGSIDEFVVFLGGFSAGLMSLPVSIAGITLAGVLVGVGILLTKKYLRWLEVIPEWLIIAFIAIAGLAAKALYA